MRGTSRRQEGLAAIESAGLEAALADPEQPGTLLELVADVAEVYWLLGSAAGAAENLEAIHGPRLERFLERLVETPVRRFVYEAGGSVDPSVLARGRSAVEAASETWRIPVEIVGGDRVGELCRRPRREGRLAQALQKVAEDAGGGAPDEVAVDLVGRGVDRHAAADEATHRVAARAGPRSEKASTVSTSAGLGLRSSSAGSGTRPTKGWMR